MSAHANIRLGVQDLVVGYGRKEVLRGASLTVESGEIVLLIGPNGSGKSTLLRVLAGLLKPTSGYIVFDDKDITQLAAHRHAERGIAYLAQSNNIFPQLSVTENFEIAGYYLNYNRPRQERVEYILKIFPELRTLRSRRAGVLSGGERQMLALAMTLLHEPKLLLLDEPTGGGLSPALVCKVFQSIKQLSDLKHTSILLAEQNIRDAAAIADRMYLLKDGRTESEIRPQEATQTDRISKAFFGEV